jgi:hypothetical protein
MKVKHIQTKLIESNQRPTHSNKSFLSQMHLRKLRESNESHTHSNKAF